MTYKLQAKTRLFHWVWKKIGPLSKIKQICEDMNVATISKLKISVIGYWRELLKYSKGSLGSESHTAGISNYIINFPFFIISRPQCIDLLLDCWKFLLWENFALVCLHWNFSNFFTHELKWHWPEATTQIPIKLTLISINFTISECFVVACEFA